jgi:hypothetical protein
MKKADSFDVLKAMSDRNKDIALAVETVQFVRQEKKGGGLVHVGVADPHFTYLINQAFSGKYTHKAVLLIYNIEQFKEIEKELSL